MEKYVTRDELETLLRSYEKQIKAKADKSQTIAVNALSGNLTLAVHDRKVQFLDPNGANRNITLPATADSTDLYFWIINCADAAEDLVVKYGGSTIITVSQDEAGIVWCNGSIWKGFMGAKT